MNDQLAGYGAGYADATEKYMKEVAVLRIEHGVLVDALKHIKQVYTPNGDLAAFIVGTLSAVSGKQPTENTSNSHKAEVSGTSNG